MRILKIFGIMLVSLVVIYFASGFIFKIIKEVTIKKDVAYLLEKNQVVVEKISCDVDSALSRISVCKLSLNDKQKEKMIESLKLEKVEKVNQSNFLFGDGYFPSFNINSCKISDPSNIEIYHSRKSEAKKEELKLKDKGQAFENMILLYNPNDGNYCLQVSYAFG